MRKSEYHNRLGDPRGRADKAPSLKRQRAHRYREMKKEEKRTVEGRVNLVQPFVMQDV